MFKIPVYKAEADAGLSEAIQANASVAFCNKVEGVDINKDKIKKFLSEASKKFDLDILYPTKSVLVTSSWNRNDDVFGVQEIWAARNTPIHTPTNINHDHTKMVGHITDTWVIDSEGNLVEDNTKIDDLPEMIHICNSAVIYKHYKEDNLTEQALELIEQIEANEKFVSMECLFPDFDYAVISPEGEHYTVTRNDDTAFLTKHLRIYKGEGKFNGYKVGRFLKNMTFSGKGYVDKPANPESVIFTDDKPDFNFSDATHKSTFNFENGVDNIMSETIKMSAANAKNSKEILMSESIYKEQLAEARTTIAELTKVKEELQTSVASANVDQLKAEIEKLGEQVEGLESEKSSLTVELTETKASVDTLTESLKEATESKNALEAEVEKAKAEKVFSDRVNALVEVGYSKDRATEAAEKFVDMTDEQFNEAKSLFGEMKREAEADRDADSRMSETDEVKSNQGTDASSEDKDKNEKSKKEKSKKDETVKAELDEALDNAEVDASDSDDVGAAASDETQEEEEVKVAVASFFADSFGLTEDSNE